MEKERAAAERTALLVGDRHSAELAALREELKRTQAQLNIAKHVVEVNRSR